MLNSQIEQLLEAQKQQFAPILKWNAFAAEAFEKVARKNYEVTGDYLEFMVAQSKVPSMGKPVPELIADLTEGSRMFSEQMAQRAAEYVELGKEISALAPVKGLKDMAATSQQEVTTAAEAVTSKRDEAPLTEKATTATRAKKEPAATA